MDSGQHITFTYRGHALEGLVVQDKDGQVTVKLDSGYNLIIPAQEMEDIKGAASGRPKAHKAPPVHQDSLLPPVTILHTGGTIASKVDYETGGVHALFEPEEIVRLFPDIVTLAHITSRFLCNMWSEDMRFAHYNIMAHAAFEEVKKDVTGVIITHGTDTLHYTAAALSFALEDVNVPVVLVGSQRSSDRGSSDSATNLLGALQFITQAKVPGVFVAMHEGSDDDAIAILDGLHVRKNHSSRRDAFAPVNGSQFARVRDGKVEILNAALAERLLRQRDLKPSLRPFDEELKVGLWKAHPQSFVEELKPYDAYDGLVIEAMGLGQIPINGIDEHTNKVNPYIREKIRKLAERIPVAIATQTIWGRVNLNVYSTGRKMQELGVLGDGCDMHPETAYIKLAWLLSNHKDDARALYGKDLRGEISARSPLEVAHRG